MNLSLLFLTFNFLFNCELHIVDLSECLKKIFSFLE